VGSFLSWLDHLREEPTSVPFYTDRETRPRYVYRAIDQFGQVIDVYVSTRRDGGAARRFFTRALATTKVLPVEVTTDKRRSTRVFSMR
jgi:transposase-like protein